MCGRYALHANPEVIALQFGLDAVPEFPPRYNIAPATEVLVVRDGKASLAHWGLRRKFANLRAETLAQKFPAVPRRPRAGPGERLLRMAVPRRAASSPITSLLRTVPSSRLAAVWENESFSLITTEPNATLRNIHDRMPVIIARDDYAAWLAGDDGLLRPAPDDALKVHPVGMAVNQAANDSPRLLEPVELPRGLFD